VSASGTLLNDDTASSVAKVSAFFLGGGGYFEVELLDGNLGVSKPVK
jgi:hypothetical protein